MVLLAPTSRDAIVRALREASSPSKIILIGSRSRDTSRQDSDIDLLVIEPRELWQTNSRHKEIGRLRRALPKLDVPVDLLLLTPEELEMWRHARNHLAHRALADGVVLHERS